MIVEKCIAEPSSSEKHYIETEETWAGGAAHA